MNAGWIGGIAGGAIGLLGGIVGTYFSIRNTRGPRERAFMVKASALCWIGIGLFLGLMFALPHPHRYLLWIPYAIVLPLGILRINRTQQRIRQAESRPR
jgi:hypothetical protein